MKQINEGDDLEKTGMVSRCSIRLWQPSPLCSFSGYIYLTAMFTFIVAEFGQNR